MRWLVLVIGLPVAVGLSIVSMMANWRFGVRLGAEDGDAFTYGLASVCADGLKGTSNNAPRHRLANLTR